jgi:hypothetical protein
MTKNVLDLFERRNDIAQDVLHHKFKLLRNEPLLHLERGVITDWASGFADRDGKLVKEFQTTFHSSLWELYLFAVLKELGLSVDFSKNRPDFIVSGNVEFYMEAVVSEIKNGGRSESTRNENDTFSMLEPIHKDKNFHCLIDEAITRHSNSILSKHKKYIKEYIKCDWVKEDTPFVVALGSYDQVNYGREFHYSMMALLYGFRFNLEGQEYVREKNIIKPETTSEIPIGIFEDKNYEEISAIVFSCTVTLGKLTSLAISKNSFHPTNFVLNIRHDIDHPHYKIQVVSQEVPEELTDGLFVFHNPNAKNPLPKSVFDGSNAIQVSVKGSAIEFSGENSPLVARFNHLKMNFPGHLMNCLIFETIDSYN